MKSQFVSSIPTYGKTYEYIKPGQIGYKCKYLGSSASDRLIIENRRGVETLGHTGVYYRRFKRFLACHDISHLVQPAPADVAKTISKCLAAKIAHDLTAQGAIDHLNKLDHQVFIVGGTVRDAIVGQASKDVDICCSMHPDKAAVAMHDYVGMSEPWLRKLRIAGGFLRWWTRNRVVVLDLSRGLVVVGGKNHGGETHLDLLGIRVDNPHDQAHPRYTPRFDNRDLPP